MSGAFALRRPQLPAGSGVAPAPMQRAAAPGFAYPLASLSRIPGLPPVRRQAKDAAETDPEKLLSSVPTFGTTALNGAGTAGQKSEAGLGTFPGASLSSVPTFGTTPAEAVRAIEQNTASSPSGRLGSAPTFASTPRSSRDPSEDIESAMNSGGTSGSDGGAVPTYRTNPARSDPIDPGVDFCGSDGNEWLPDFPLGFDFRQACINHDACYDSDETQAACDKAFLTDMVQICFEGARKGKCLATAGTYYLGIRAFGKKAYRAAQRARLGKT